MIKEWVSDQSALVAPAIGLVLFLVFFVAVLFWIYRPGSKSTYDEESQLPFTDEERRESDQDTAAPERRE